MALSTSMPRRGWRYPRVSSLINAEPFKLYPIMVHPVLPGETVRRMFVDGRIHLNGVQSMLTGWYADIMFAYVKIRDIDADLVQHLIDDSLTIPSEYQSTTNRDAGEVSASTRIAYPTLMTALLYEYFYAREKTYYHGGLPILPLKYPGCFQEFFELAEDQDSDLADAPGILARMVEDIDNYAEVLEAYGLRDAIVARTLPEILLWRSYHNYPVLAPIDDNSEILTRSQCLWTFRESRLTSRGVYITEPGFIIGVAATRPDVVEGNKLEWQATKFVNQKDWLVPPYELEDFIGTIQPGLFDNFSYVSNLHYNRADTWLNGESYTNVDPDSVTLGTQILGSVAKIPSVDAGFTDIRTDYPRQGAMTDLDTYAPNLLKSDYYQGFSFNTRFSIETYLVE